ncbi:hypothetical protein [Methylobacterium nodulans]|uniref:Uncharacterized protein n=1 Tax=Methylobacterium nodulans (strain LMG 21967 / CNCM I-2342 / ORS 2060) TaxID=460265 RepID=B8IIR1_METNO|nr:hypothetical protein [Methylobacterium nodulans]ACL59938.1 conserved hypothetical protein [Methylobacterium nodulans ORS 2060]
MTPPTPQNQAAASLAGLGAPAPWAPLTASGRQIVDATGRIALLIIPTGNAARDHELAAAVAKAINAAAGADDAAPCHEAVSAQTTHVLRRVGAVTAE